MEKNIASAEVVRDSGAAVDTAGATERAVVPPRLGFSEMPSWFCSACAAADDALGVLRHQNVR
jgi:hypothetical protein